MSQILSSEAVVIGALRVKGWRSESPDEDQYAVWPDLDPDCSTLMIFLKDFLKLIFERNQQTMRRQKGMQISQHAKSYVNRQHKDLDQSCLTTWVKVFKIVPEFRILRLTFHRKSASKS